MTTLPEVRQPRSWLAEISDVFPSWTGLHSLAGTHPIRVEEEVQDGHYLVRAELPGIDPAQDVDITLCENQLTIKAERSEKKESNGRSEFSYGSFLRSIRLPSGADPDDVTASYDKGILTVDVALPKAPAPEVRHVAVTTASTGGGK